ncbi:MAG: hypothetical protein ACI8W0_000820 [Flavobacterium sp.]|jgi:hypothetical protein
MEVLSIERIFNEISFDYLVLPTLNSACAIALSIVGFLLSVLSASTNFSYSTFSKPAVNTF